MTKPWGCLPCGYLKPWGYLLEDPPDSVKETRNNDPRNNGPWNKETLEQGNPFVLSVA